MNVDFSYAFQTQYLTKGYFFLHPKVSTQGVSLASHLYWCICLPP